MSSLSMLFFFILGLWQSGCCMISKVLLGEVAVLTQALDNYTWGLLQSEVNNRVQTKD